MFGVGDTLSNDERGCGFLVPGGTYLTAHMGSGGTLNALTWIHGAGNLESHNYLWTQAARQMGLANFRASLSEGYLVTDMAEIMGAELQSIPRAVIVDHVGNEYDPFQFGAELATRGPSRRVSPILAKTVARHLPMPIVFTHSGCLFAPTEEAQREFVLSVVQDLATYRMDQGWQEDVPDDLDMDAVDFFTPVHMIPTWGMDIGSYNPIDHAMLWAHKFTMLARANSGKEKVYSWKELLTLDMLQKGFNYLESAFCASWITDCVYVCLPGEDAEDMGDLMESGITPVYAADARESKEVDRFNDVDRASI